MKNIFRILFCLFVIGNLFATITYTPVRPNVEQEITFTASHPDGIVGDEVFWDFGDGSAPLWSTSTISYNYKRTGTFLVKATYITLKQQQVTDQISVTVIENRKIRVSPLYPVPNSPTTFTAENFLSNNILWDFGDGTPPQCSSPVETHTYTALGKYTVKAQDWCGNSQTVITLQINVTEQRGPRAAFQVSYIQLRFEDGKSYKVVGQNAPLLAYADIKCKNSE
ncbi:MAG: PKD domain-containing protein [Candidatus Saccharicenans sp.]